jgi:D-sedoheptulose 7-phosphate isomerase
MQAFISTFLREVVETLDRVPAQEIAKALNLLQATYERDGRIYVFGNGGSLALATHWVSDFNKTVFNHRLGLGTRRFQAIRLPSTEEEMSAWANDVGYHMVFAGPLQNYIQDIDCVIAISSSGNSANVIEAVKLSNACAVPVIGISGFDGGELNELADAKLLVSTEAGRYDLVESVHCALLHLMTKYFQDYFNSVLKRTP